MKANNTLKGQALRTYNRVMNAMTEDNDASMLHTFAAMTQQAKSIALQSGKFSNAYVRGELKGMTAEEAAKDLTARAAACVSCKVRNIDMIIATAFLAEYISRQRKEIETPSTPNPTTSDTMNTETKAMNEVNELSNAGYCLDVYLNNTAEIYERYTVPAIAECVKSMSAKSPAMLELVKKALQAAVRLVKKYDHMTPTAKDIHEVTRNYAAYIVESAKYEVENA